MTIVRQSGTLQASSHILDLSRSWSAVVRREGRTAAQGASMVGGDQDEATRVTKPCLGRVPGMMEAMSL